MPIAEPNRIDPTSALPRSDIRIVATDFDLTVYDYRDPPSMRSLERHFKDLAARNVMIGLASGRERESLQHELEKIGFEWGSPYPAFVICNEGEILRTDGTPWPGAQAWNSHRLSQVEMWHGVIEARFDCAVSWANRRRIPLTRPVRKTPGGVDVVFDTPQNAERVRQWLLEKFGDDGRQTVLTRNHHIVLSMPANVSKGAALTELARLVDVQPSQVLAIGDNLNDWSMLGENRGFRVGAVANAIDEIKAGVLANGGYVASEPISRGVAEILDHFG